MHYEKLKKAIKTVVRSFEIGADGKPTDKETAKREVEIPVEVPAYDNLADATQAAGGEDKLIQWINKHVKAEAVAPVRLVGNKFTADDHDDVIIKEGQTLAHDANVFAAKARGQGKNKELADRMRSLEALVKTGASDADLLAMLKASLAA